MALYSIIIGVVAGICLGFAMIFGFVGLRRGTDRRLNLLFALFALGYAGTLINGLLFHKASSVETFVAFNRWDPIFTVTALVALVWYVAEYTQVRPRWLLWGLTAAYVTAGFAHITRPTLSFGEIAGLQSIVLPWGEEIVEIAATDSIWSMLYLLAQLATVIYILTAAILQFRRGERRAASLLGIGAGWLVFTLAVELAGEAGLIPYFPLAEIGFIGLAITSSIQMSDDVIRTEEEIASYRATLEATVAERTAELRAAQTRLVEQAQETAAANERSRLARDLHDAVTQTLYSSALIAEALPNVWDRDPKAGRESTLKLRQMVRSALAEMRALLFELRPESLRSTDLSVLLSQLATAFTGRTRIPIAMNLESRTDGWLPPDTKVAIFRIVQEALNNIGKHADATSVSMESTSSMDRWTLIIADNGIGFDPAQVEPGRLGLEIMAERAKAVGADFKIESWPGQGATIRLVAPIQQSDSAHG